MANPIPVLRRAGTSSTRRAPLRIAAAVIVVAGLSAAMRAAAQDAATLPLTFEEASARLETVSDGLAAADANVGSKRDLAEATGSLRLPDVSLDVREIKYPEVARRLARRVGAGARATRHSRDDQPAPARLALPAERDGDAAAVHRRADTGCAAGGGRCRAPGAGRTRERGAESDAATGTGVLWAAARGACARGAARGSRRPGTPSRRRAQARTRRHGDEGAAAAGDGRASSRWRSRPSRTSRRTSSARAASCCQSPTSCSV